MTGLDPALQAQLADHFELLRDDVVLTAAPDADPTLHEFLTAFATTSARLTLEPGAGLRTDEFAIRAAGTDRSKIRFVGIPSGHEFTSLVLAVLHTGGHPPRVDAAVLDQFAAVRRPLRFETFYSASCQNCPEVVQALNILATYAPDVEHIAYDGAVCPEEASRRDLRTVPTVFLDGEVFLQGRASAAEIADRLEAHGLLPDRSAHPVHRGVVDVLVVGAGPAGAAAAVYAARKGLRVAVVAPRFGGQVLDTQSIENLVSVPHTTGPELAADLEAHVRRYNVECILARNVASIDPSGSTHRVTLDDGSWLDATAVVLATGARWRTLDISGEDEYRNKGVTFCPHCDGPLFAGQRVAVVGGGNSGIEAALDLAGIASHVTVVEAAPAPRADQVLLDALARRSNVSLRCNVMPEAVVGDGSAVTGLWLRDTATGVVDETALAGVFVQIGLVPNTAWLPAALERTPSGEVRTDAHGRTSLPGVFAAGDAADTPNKQIVTALASGATAAIAAHEYCQMRLPLSA